MQTQSGFASVNGTQLYFEVSGSGEALVFIHGFTLDNRMWDDQVNAFASRYRVLRYDIRGFGQSAMPADQSYSRIEDLKALLEHLGIVQAVIVGLSMGGEIALNFALTYPQATRALILADALLPGFAWSPEGAASFAPVNTAAKERGVQAAKDLWLAHPLFVPAGEQSIVAARLAAMVETYSGWHWVETDPDRAPETPAAQRLTLISASTLIIVGERDMPDFVAMSAMLAQQIPQSRQVIMPGIGHMSNMEDPVRWNEIVLTFLAAL